MTKHKKTTFKMDLGTIESFLPEKNNQEQEKKYEPLFIRFFRKKYKCLLIFILSLTVLSQLFVVLLEKTDETILNKLLSFALKEENKTSLLFHELDQLLNSSNSSAP